MKSLGVHAPGLFLLSCSVDGFFFHEKRLSILLRWSNVNNRLVRVMDSWANDVGRIFGNSYLGLETNNDTGRQLFKAAAALRPFGRGAGLAVPGNRGNQRLFQLRY